MMSMSDRSMRDANPRTVGFDAMVVRIEDVSDRIAHVVDGFGRHISVNIDIRRSSGPRPRVGERWVIDRAFGDWTLTAIVRSIPPVITGDVDGNTALRALLDALNNDGLIEDQTTG